MYKYITGPEPGHGGWEQVNKDERCEDCGERNKNCECSSGYQDEPNDPPDFEDY